MSDQTTNTKAPATNEAPAEVQACEKCGSTNHPTGFHGTGVAPGEGEQRMSPTGFHGTGMAPPTATADNGGSMDPAGFHGTGSVAAASDNGQAPNSGQ